MPRRQKEKVSTLFSLLQYEASTVAVIHELVLPTEGNSFFPLDCRDYDSAQLRDWGRRGGSNETYRVREIQ